MKWRARVSIDGIRETQTVSVEAKTASEANQIFHDWFCSTHQNSDGTMWSDYVLYSDWEQAEKEETHGRTNQ